MNDVINSPEHYVKNSIMLQPIELSNRLDGSLSQAVQYVVRRNDKNTAIENLGKAVFELRWCARKLVHKKEYRFTCVSMEECRFYIDLFINHTKDDFFRAFLMTLFVDINSDEDIWLNLDEAIDFLEDEIERLKGLENENCKKEESL